MTDLHVAEGHAPHAAEGRAPRAAIPSGATRFAPVLLASADIAVLSGANSLLAHVSLFPQGIHDIQGFLAVALVAWAFALGHYTRRLSFGVELGQIVRLVLGLVVVANAVALHQATGHWQLPLTVLHGAALVAALAGTRQGLRLALDAAGLWRIPTLVIGGANADRIAAALDSGAPGYRVVGTLRPGDGEWEARIGSACDQADIQMAIVDPEAATGERGGRLVHALRRRGIDVALAPSLGELPVRGVQAQTVFAHDVVLLTPPPALGRELAQTAKRLLDGTLAALALLLASPLMLAVAVAVKSDGGPLLFGHLRVGRNGRLFPCWKFRTMVPKAEAVLTEVLARDPVRAEEWRQTLKLKDDPRVTAIGGFLRRSSLDELPQLFNVLYGQMSLIGPRPVTKGELERYGEVRDDYLSVRPGITGLWQVMGRNDTSYAQRVRLDAWYVRNWSLWHDLVILLRTIPAVLRRSGAY